MGKSKPMRRGRGVRALELGANGLFSGDTAAFLAG
jgi:hypothetical protein